MSPTYFGAVADIAGLAEVAHARGVPLVVDEAWGAHLAFHRALPAHALSLGADLVISSIHKIVGSLTQSAMIHLGHGEPDRGERRRPLRDADRVDQPELAPVRIARRRAPQRRGATGRDMLGETLAALRRVREAVREIPGLEVLDERLAGAPGRLRLRPAPARHRRARHDRERLRARTARARAERRASRARGRERDGRRIRHGRAGRPGRQAAGRRARQAVDTVSEQPAAAAQEPFAPPPPWGELVMTPREAFLGPQEVVATGEAVGRVAAESLAAYPPGIPNVLPGERLTAETLEYIEQTLAHGGSLRGASDRELRTLRVALER